MCSLDVAFMFATVRAIRGRAYGKFSKDITFGGFTCGVALFRVAGMALRDIQTCLVTCRKYFCDVFRRCVAVFRGMPSALDVSIVILRRSRSTLDVSRCVFFARAASSGDTANTVAFCGM